MYILYVHVSYSPESTSNDQLTFNFKLKMFKIQVLFYMSLRVLLDNTYDEGILGQEYGPYARFFVFGLASCFLMHVLQRLNKIAFNYGRRLKAGPQWKISN